MSEDIPQFAVMKRESIKPPFMVIYGPSGVGKTTFPFSGVNPLYLPTEDGAGEMALNTLKEGVFTSYDEFLDALTYVYKNGSELELSALVTDSIDHLEPMVWQKICEMGDVDSIEKYDGGYGKGYIEADKLWMRIINGMIKIRDKHNIAIVVLAHDIVRNVNDPQHGAYDAHELKLHKRAVALWKEKVDMIGLLKNSIAVDAKTKKAKGGTVPTLHVRPSAAYTAKTRYRAMPSTIPIKEATGWDDVCKYIPFYNQDKKEVDTA